MAFCSMDKDMKEMLIAFIDSEIAEIKAGEAEDVTIDDLEEARAYLEKCSTEQVAVSKKGRQLSKYQMFMSECMRKPENGGRGIPFADCILDWKEQKGQ